MSAARRAARLLERERAAGDRARAITAERDAAWTEAVELGMSRAEVAKIAGVHHSAVDRVLNGG